MKNTTICVVELIKEFRDKLANLYSPDEIRQIVYMLFESYLNWPKATVHLSFNEILPETTLFRFEQALTALRCGEPIQYIIGVAWFNGIKLKVDKRVLIPRSETEELCAAIKTGLQPKTQPNFTILDIGTGSGCIAIDLKRYFPEAIITAIDISNDALKLAKENAFDAKCDIMFSVIDILSHSDQKTMGCYDLIVSNPPYITESEKQFLHRNVSCFEPAAALFVPDEDPLIFYRAISSFAKQHLKCSGKLYFEINERFGKQTIEMLIESGFSQVELINDMNGKPRFTYASSMCS